jgi:hypothetical protein
MVVFLPQMHHLGSEPVPIRCYVNAEPDISLKLTVLFPYSQMFGGFNFSQHKLK